MIGVSRRTAWALSACLAVVGVALLVADHWAHALGVLPYVILLACPLMHLLHGRHGGHSGSSPPTHGGRHS